MSHSPRTHSPGCFEGTLYPSPPHPRRVAVLMGGQSAERDVSLKSGETVVEKLACEHYLVKPVAIHADGSWEVPGGYLGRGITDRPGDWFSGTALAVEKAIGRLRAEGVEVAFIALHGPRGEDGTVQGLLEMAGIPYTGPQVTSAAATMDKRLTKEVLRASGIPTPRYFSVGPEAPRSGGRVDWRRLLRWGQDSFPFPWVLKPNRLGSSVGVFIAKDGEQFLSMAGEAEGFIPWATGGHPELGGEILVEEFIQGRELTCGVAALADGMPRPLPPIEIRPVSRAFFDYHAKYTPGATEEICPAPLSPDLTRQVQALAVAVHRALRADPLSRTDFILDSGGTPQVLEINTIPGMTATSLIPLSASRAGLDLGALLRGLVEHAVRRAGGD